MAIVRENDQKWPILGLNFKDQKSYGKGLQAYMSCSIENTTQKNIKHAKSDTILKSGKNGNFGKITVRQNGQK